MIHAHNIMNTASNTGGSIPRLKYCLHSLVNGSALYLAYAYSKRLAVYGLNRATFILLKGLLIPMESCVAYCSDRRTVGWMNGEQRLDLWFGASYERCLFNLFLGDEDDLLRGYIGEDGCRVSKVMVMR
ncbi:hypothetical protein Ccrd_022425 [Cynara cardunculus var. scolymus]|uniref:Uncharacterized protein n=1 Tax=Cynara cardunculus var. scolymus TaxID=59895 RepID=A0A103XYS5_CYNCS|nr:hypothetical protein Ccrd_022425 [Cynara cardunculus var. scolymus]